MPKAVSYLEEKSEGDSSMRFKSLLRTDHAGQKDRQLGCAWLNLNWLNPN